MGIWTEQEREFAKAISNLAFTNPFQSDELSRHIRLAVELSATLETPPRLLRSLKVRGRPELGAAIAAAANLISDLGARFEKASDVTSEEFGLYQDLVLVVMYYSFRERFQETIEQSMNCQDAEVQSPQTIDYYVDFERQWQIYWDGSKIKWVPEHTCQHAFACLFLIRRAYYHVHEYIWGDSPAIRELRAETWHSIFTHDFRRYGLLLYSRMEDVTTLISGPSGTGKELVARAIGLSRYIPFDPRLKQFTEQFFSGFHPVNISAFAHTIAESELFGHVKGAFTDAVKTRPGLFELCKSGHSVFLDEIGELSSALQVKLLRVVQNREFQRLGETRLRKFGGKLIVATNRDFSKELAQGNFREDLYYRLCSDVISTPSLKRQVQGDAGQLRAIAEKIAFRQLGDTQAAADVAGDTIAWIKNHLGLDYEWPGNFRELEQCVRNVLIRKSYQPVKRPTQSEDATLSAIRQGKATADEVVSHYCKLVYTKTGSYAATASIVGLDQRTVKKRVHNGPAS